MTIYEKMFKIQQTVKANKNQYNGFGKYNYRSAEGIIEDIKPILASTNTFIVLSDEMVEVGGRVYIKAMATLYDAESETTISSTGFAREAESKKGMDESQITGSTSSYARKYALSGLLLLDDNKDADTNEYYSMTHTETPKQTAPKQTAPKNEEPKVIKKFKCSDCGNLIKDHQGVSAEKIAEATRKKYGVMICMECSAKRRAEAEQQTVPQPVPSEPQVAEPVEEDGGELPFDLA